MMADSEEWKDKCRGFLYNYIPDSVNCFVSGGVFPRLYHNIPIRDIDVYYTGPDSEFDEFVRDYHENPSMEVIKRSPRFMKFNHKHSGVKIDIINFHKPRTIAFVNFFDFTICKGVFSEDKFSLQGNHSFDDIIQKKLIFTGMSNFSVENHILIRLKKYQELGFTIDNDELTRIYNHLTKNEVRYDYALSSYGV